MKTLLCFLLCAFCFSTKAAVSFDASNDILGTAQTSLTGPLPLTISAWIFVAGEHETEGVILYRRTASNTGGWRFSCVGTNASYTASGTNTLLFQVAYPSPLLLKTSSPQAVPLNVWTHVAVTWSASTSTNSITLYTNAVATGSYQLQNGGGTYGSDANLAFNIGNRAATDWTFNGKIAEVAVWTNVLTVAELSVLASSRLARKPLMVRPTNLIAYWPLDGGADGTAVTAANCIYDLSGKGNHASPTNSPTWKASPLGYP